MHLGRILTVKGIKVGDVITKSGAQCEKHKRWGQSVKFTEKVEPVGSGEPRRSSGSQSSLEVVVESRSVEGWTCQTTGTKCHPQLP